MEFEPGAAGRYLPFNAGQHQRQIATLGSRRGSPRRQYKHRERGTALVQRQVKKRETAGTGPSNFAELKHSLAGCRLSSAPSTNTIAVHGIRGRRINCVWVELYSEELDIIDI